VAWISPPLSARNAIGFVENFAVDEEQQSVAGRFFWTRRRASIGGMSALRILLVEDETRLADAVKQGLGEEGFTVETAESAEAAEPIIARGALDLIVLDLQLPGKNGIDLLRELRAGGNQTPVLILTARGSLEERVAGLDVGGDDYLTKPFAFAELVARIKALARRPRTKSSPILKVGDLEFDTIKRRAKIGEHSLNLSPKEKMLLELLMRHAGEVVTRDMIAETVWDSNYNSLTNLIEVFVNRLRQKIDPRADRSLIITVRGEGYTMRAD
jgi:DNA-binding response OmpR family regulator